MATPSDWKSQMSFSDRISYTLKLSASLRRAFPESSESDARTEASKIENSILQRSSSKSEYERICHETAAEYQKLTPEQDLNHDSNATIAPSATTEYQIGSFDHCTYHRSGLFSTIYKRIDPGRKERCAIKVTTPGSEQPPHNSAREARLLRKAIHTNVIELLAVNKLSNGQLLMRFPFMPLTLEDVLGSDSRISVRETVVQLFQGLDHIHRLHAALKYPKATGIWHSSANSRRDNTLMTTVFLGTVGILHRDLKPSNILLTKRESPNHAFNICIADFGTAWHRDDPDSEPADAKITDIGTTCYRAPELLFGCRNYQEGIDLWSAGCVVAEIVMHQARLNGVNHIRSGWTLFDAGDLGSELALVKSIFETLGTPNEERWPETRELPDWGKMSFVIFPGKPWSEILLGADGEAIDVVSRLVKYQSTERMAASQVRFI